VGVAEREERAVRVKMEEKAARGETVKIVSWDAMAAMVVLVETRASAASEDKVEMEV
jgi:hypothetical protein